MTNFTHFDHQGNAIMADISQKEETARCAIAEGKIKMNAECYEAVRSGDSKKIKKGDVLGVARIAGIMAVKQTPALIPLCHTLLITKASVDFTFDDASCEITAICTVKTKGATGVEMEALTGVSATLLTIYDMCKSVDRAMEMDGIHLMEKAGGKSGHYKRLG